MFKVAALLITLALTANAQSGTGYATYHLYNAGDSINTVACSDGVNGIGTKWGYTTLSNMYPYVTASSLVPSWNSPNCGLCVKLIDQASGSYATVIDHCDSGVGGYANHFDISQPAFTTLFGQAGINAGHGIVNWQVVSGASCQGNKGGAVASSSSSSSSGTPSSSSGSSCGTYTVKSGDTLSTIASSHGTTWQALCSANALPNCDTLSVGQVLKLC